MNLRILFLAFAGLAQLVARNLAKVEVAGSNPVARSMIFRPDLFGLFYTSSLARWPSGKAEACKAFIPGSNPGLASSELTTPASAGVSFFGARPCLLEFWIASLKSAKSLYLRHRFFDKIRQINRFFYIFRQKLQILCGNQARSNWGTVSKFCEPENSTMSE